MIGTNGAIEAYVTALAVITSSTFGAEDPMARFFASQVSGFFPGIDLDLDELLPDRSSRKRFLAVLREALAAMQQQTDWSEIGLNWLRSSVPAFLSDVENEL